MADSKSVDSFGKKSYSAPHLETHSVLRSGKFSFGNPGLSAIQNWNAKLLSLSGKRNSLGRLVA